jgi:hypothetical protein
MKDDRVKQKMIEKFQENSIIAHICKKVNISRSTFYRWIEDDHIFKDATKKARNIGRDNICDAAEFRILFLMNKGQESVALNAAKFILLNNSSRYKSSNLGYQRIKLENKIEELKNKENRQIETVIDGIRELIDRGSQKYEEDNFEDHNQEYASV